jgi:predicted HD superfamily hydrolase involved in NAD metabolism
MKTPTNKGDLHHCDKMAGGSSTYTYMDPLAIPYIPFLERVLTPNRLRHSLGVMHVMSELARIYGLDREQAILTGLLHDAGKDLPPERQDQIIVEAGISIQTPCDRDFSLYLHGPVSAFFIQKELGITDPLILDAITTHTYYGEGENFEAPLTWCLRFSDLLEPNRHWDQKARWIGDNITRLRRLVYNGNLTEASFFQTGILIRFFDEMGYPTHPNMHRIYQELSIQLDLDDTWFLSR